MTELMAEFMEMDKNNQKLLQAKSKYLPIYTVHKNGLESFIARNYKRGEKIHGEHSKKYRICWGDGIHHIFTADEFNKTVIGSEEYEKHFREFPNEVLIGEK